MLTRNDRLIAEEIAATHAPEVNVAEQLAAATGAEAAAWAIVAGQTADMAALPTLVTLLGEDDLAGQAAAWALGTLGAEDALRAAIPGGRIDARCPDPLELGVGDVGLAVCHLDAGSGRPFDDGVGDPDASFRGEVSPGRRAAAP